MSVLFNIYYSDLYRIQIILYLDFYIVQSDQIILDSDPSFFDNPVKYFSIQSSIY